MMGHKYFVAEEIILTERVLFQYGFVKHGKDEYPRSVSYEKDGLRIFPSHSNCDFEGYGCIWQKPKEDGGKESAMFKLQYLSELKELYYLRTKEPLWRK